MKALYGPLYSRRLGMSLGLDIIPYKTCSYNCIYCHEGETTSLTLERREYLPPEQVLRELSTLKGEKIFKGRSVDYITFAGSGEPTLNTNIGSYISYLKDNCPIPIAVITNGSLLWKEEVRRSIMGADLVIPSLDALSEDSFQRINRPFPGLSLEKVLQGLVDFCENFSGAIWLEILLCSGINDSFEELEHFASLLKDLPLQKIQVNTVSRPPAEFWAFPSTPEKLDQCRELLGPRVTVIEDTLTSIRKDLEGRLRRRVCELLQRRPYTLEELQNELQKSGHEIIKVVARMEKEGLVERTLSNNKSLFYRKKGQIKEKELQK